MEKYINKITLEIAETPSQHEQGLMYRKSMDNDSGMLFKFTSPRKLKFWGMNTYLPLDIAFINDDNIIEKICHIVPFSEKVVYSDNDCTKALEMNAGYFADNNIRVGDEMSLVEDENFAVFKKIKEKTGN